jgi:ankyrin repeat protein
MQLIVTLHYAALSASSGTETMRVLIAHGADVNACDLRLNTPLHAAAKSAQLDKIEVLIAAGADVICGDALGATALHVANTLYIQQL